MTFTEAMAEAILNGEQVTNDFLTSMYDKAYVYYNTGDDDLFLVGWEEDGYMPAKEDKIAVWKIV